jgi:hypothetical protein
VHNPLTTNGCVINCRTGLIEVIVESFLDDYMLTPTMTKFVKCCQEKAKPIIAHGVVEALEGLSSVRGSIDYIRYKKQEIEDDMLNNTLLKNHEIKELDKTLQEIMNR